MKLGITGTRNGLTPAQQQAFIGILAETRPTEFHHGACVGADAEAAHLMALQSHGYKIVAHPGRPAGGGANEFLDESALSTSDVVHPALGHFARNRNIVNACDRLVACPWQSERPAKGTGGGTWYTIEYGEKVGKPVTILWPDGRVENVPGRG